MTRRILLLVAALFAAGVAGLNGASPVSAHENIESSTPENGEVLSEPIDEVTIDFGVEISGATQMFLRYEDADGEIEQIGGDVTVTGPTTARLDFPLLEREGTYFVNYIAPVPADAHVITGAIGFVYGAPTVFVSDDPNVLRSTPFARETISEPISEVTVEFAAAVADVRFFFSYDEGDGETFTSIEISQTAESDVDYVVTFDELDRDGTYILSYLARYAQSDDEISGDIPFFLGAPSGQSDDTSFPWLVFVPIAAAILAVGAWFSWRRMTVDVADDDGDSDGDSSGDVDEDLADVGV